jgi:hypothetical protein
MGISFFPIESEDSAKDRSSLERYKPLERYDGYEHPGDAPSRIGTPAETDEPQRTYALCGVGLAQNYLWIGGPTFSRIGEVYLLAIDASHAVDPFSFAYS